MAAPVCVHLPGGALKPVPFTVPSTAFQLRLSTSSQPENTSSTSEPSPCSQRSRCRALACHRNAAPGQNGPRSSGEEVGEVTVSVLSEALAGVCVALCIATSCA